MDILLLRKVLRAPRSTPKEMLFLELGCLPLREIIRKRRILFLQYILKQDRQSMMYKFLETQMKNRKPRDWITQVLKDIKELHLDISLENINQMTKEKLKIILNKAVKIKALEELNRKKQNHSKGKEIKYSFLEMQKYLRPSKINIKHEDAITIFRLRARMTDVKVNFKGKYENLACKICKKENETQDHILKCEKISTEVSPEYHKIFEKDVQDQVKIAKIFNENIKRRNSILKMV